MIVISINIFKHDLEGLIFEYNCHAKGIIKRDGGVERIGSIYEPDKEMQLLIIPFFCQSGWSAHTAKFVYT